MYVLLKNPNEKTVFRINKLDFQNQRLNVSGSKNTIGSPPT